jgi:putative PIN family toxin of toxin-antitoxin system
VNHVLNRRLLLCWSDYVIKEVRRIPQKPTPRKLGITDAKIEALVTRIASVAALIANVPAIYAHPVDPKDSHYVNLALASGASIIVTRDKHLLYLTEPSRSQGVEFKSQFPDLLIMQPEQLLQRLEPPR